MERLVNAAQLMVDPTRRRPDAMDTSSSSPVHRSAGASGVSHDLRRCPVLKDLFARNFRGYKKPAEPPYYGGEALDQAVTNAFANGLAGCGSLGSEHAQISGAITDPGAAAGASTAAVLKRAKVKVDVCCANTQRGLLELRHAGKCSGQTADGRACPVQGCREKKALWSHLSICSENNCGVQNCKLSAWQARQLSHLKKCTVTPCNICQPVKDFINKSRTDCINKGILNGHQPESAPSMEGPSPTGGSSIDADMDDLTSRLGSMSVLLQGSSQDDETAKLMEAMAAISIDSDTRQQRRPPAIGLRGPGAAFQVMGASVARDANNIFRIGSTNADGSPKRKGTRFSSRLRDLKCKARAGRAVAGTGDSARKRQNKNKSPVWRVDRKDQNVRFMEKLRYDCVFNAGRWSGGMDDGAGASRADRDDVGDGGDGAGPFTDDGGSVEAATRGGSATNAAGNEHDENPCKVWDECMGGEETGAGSEGERDGLAVADQTALNANIAGKNNSVEDDQRKFLILLFHLHTCRADGDGEMCHVTRHCPALRRMWRHVKTCDAKVCPIAEAMCTNLSSLVQHLDDCNKACRLCDYVRYVGCGDQHVGDDT
ncbi:unnamed protein product [Ectocarpus fasciculatus]